MKIITRIIQENLGLGRVLEVILGLDRAAILTVVPVDLDRGRVQGRVRGQGQGRVRGRGHTLLTFLYVVARLHSLKNVELRGNFEKMYFTNFFLTFSILF